ncbi:MAG: N-6 DNA methylase, partial [Thermoflexales bacterium]|nr:N-6 DNA methylase [Thermoflexales bacterium]
MHLIFDQAKDEIAKLVRHFHTNARLYHAPDYKEAHARQEFIDPLFIALGWDVHNAQRAAPNYREVVVEASLDVEGSRKAPDYAFRMGRDIRFFAEAKKPGVSIKTGVGPAYQLRRYAWSLKLPLSLLTDFEELAVYDCHSRPSEKDKAVTGRTQFYTYEEYPDRWREVWDVFSREAVLAGAFDQFAQSSKGRRGTSEVDVEFLKEVEAWRNVLAHNIALRNPRLTVDELNDAVQRTIDRIVFLRMAEDRGMEEYERLQRLAETGNIYPGLIELCRKADTRYNSGLFDLRADKLTLDLVIDDKALKPILSNLYFPASPYEFSVLPTEILGNVYEQFLGKVIRLTPAHQAKVEEKPQVRKAGGVYYTPTYIVEYIVRNTVGRLVKDKGPKQLEDVRVLDMACGSGSFLLGAYQCLLDHYLAWYATHNPEKHAKAVWQHGEEWRLTTAEKKRILTTHIFGVDIDRQAVEVTKLSLLLKVLEGESDETLGKQLALFQERALPNLDQNIKCGNSLIGP